MGPTACRLAFVAFSLAAGGASAQPTVVVMHGERAPQRPGLVSALRVQLAGIGNAEDGGELPPGGLLPRVAAASASARGKGAVLGVWVEPEAPQDGEQQLVLYLVGPSDGPALLEVMRLPDGTEADADRTLALKIREVFDRVRDGTAAQAMAASIAEPTAPSDIAPTVYGVTVSVGALWAPALVEREPSAVGLETAFGVLAVRGDMAYALSLRISLPAGTELRRAGQRLELSERSFLGGVTAHRRDGRLQLGARVAAGIRRIDAAGTTQRGTSRSVDADAAVLRMGPLARFDLLDRMAIETWVGLEINGAPRSFEVSGIEVARSGALRPFVVIALGIDAI